MTMACLAIFHLTVRGVLALFAEHPFAAAGPVWVGVTAALLLLVVGVVWDVLTLLALLWFHAVPWPTLRTARPPSARRLPQL